MLPKDITIGDKYQPAMAVATQAEAATYFELCVEHCMSFGKSRIEAEAIERQNIGYFAGYCDHATRERVERLFACAHPVFGSIRTNGPPTAVDAFNKGVALGQKVRKR